MCERDDVGGGESWGKGGRGATERGGDGWRGGAKLETCFEILIRGPGRGLVHRDEKTQGEPLKRGNVPCICEVGAAQAAMLVESNWGRCDVFLPHI